MAVIDLDALEAGIAEGEAKHFFVAPIVKTLIAELREAREQRRIDNEEAARLYDFARDKGQALERDAVVAHLRERALHGAGNTVTVEDACNILADLFENGEHRREEGR